MIQMIIITTTTQEDKRLAPFYIYLILLGKSQPVLNVQL
jgi:hypothetical protein